MFAIRTILCPTDFSAPSRAAVATAESLAREFDARVIVMHVVSPPPAMMAEGLLMYPAEHEPETMRHSLDDVKPEDPNVEFEHVFVEGEPVPEILRVAEDRHCDLIVLGTHGRRGVGRLLLGSVAEQVIRRAPCPVLSVKAPLAVVEADLPEAMAATMP
jgi:nucleotide-binding universal stress UspA family protein